jgi:hypothetical protein
MVAGSKSNSLAKACKRRVMSPTVDLTSYMWTLSSCRSIWQYGGAIHGIVIAIATKGVRKVLEAVMAETGAAI